MTETFNDILKIYARKTEISNRLRETLVARAEIFNAQTETLKSTISRTGDMLEQFILNEAAECTGLAKNINSCTKFVSKLEDSSIKLEEASTALASKIESSVASIEYCVDAENLLVDMNSSFEKCFSAHTAEVFRRIHLLQDKLNTISHQCGNIVHLPKIYTDIINNYSSRMEAVFSIIDKQETVKREKLKEKRNTLAAYFLIDCSRSMKGPRIEAVNTAVPRIIQGLDRYGISETKVLSFSTKPQWLYKTKPASVYDDWNNPLRAEGITNIGAAFFELFRELSGKKTRKAPLIVIISDGEPTDDWDAPLTSLKQLDVFNDAEKYVFVLEYDEEIQALNAFAGSKGKVFKVKQASFLLPMMIRVIGGEEKVAEKNNAAESKPRGANADAADKYYLSKNFVSSGPFTWERIIKKISTGEVTKDWYIQKEGGKWVHVYYYSELKEKIDGYLMKNTSGIPSNER